MDTEIETGSPRCSPPHKALHLPVQSLRAWPAAEFRRLDISNQESGREKFMKINIVYKREKGWFVGHIQEYPDYESQGKTLEELRDNLIEIYDDIRKGLVPDAEPFQILEVAI